MSILKEDYKIASEIFYNLLKTGEIKEKKHKDLFLAYVNSEGVREALDCISSSSKSRIIIISDGLYLVPDMDNDILGFDFRKDATVGGNVIDSYISCLIMTIIFAEFTNEYAPSSYIRVMDILDLVKESLNKSASKSDIKELEDINSFNILAIKALWDAKPPFEEVSDKDKEKERKYRKIGKYKTSRDFQIGYVRRVVSFLKKEDLISYIEDEDKIVVTDRFRDLMNGYFLDENRKKEIESIFLGKDN